MELSSIIEARLGDKPVKLILDVDKNIPSKLYGDSTKLFQILLNILTNAVKYTEVGKIKLTIEGTPEGDYEKLNFKITDTGYGIKKEDYNKLFEKFSRLETATSNEIEGTGLGLQFLRHIERTRLLLHVIDVSGSEGRNPLEDFKIINSELKKYSEKLSKRKQIIVANKIDSMQDENLYKELYDFAQKEKIEIFKISAVTGEGIRELLNRVSKVLKELPKEELVEVENSKKIYELKDEPEFTIFKEGKIFVVDGPAVQKVMRKVNIQDNESLHYFHKCLEELGVNEKLKQAGVQDGDTVRVVDWELEWYD